MLKLEGLESCQHLRLCVISLFIIQLASVANAIVNSTFYINTVAIIYSATAYAAANEHSFRQVIFVSGEFQITSDIILTPVCESVCLREREGARVRERESERASEIERVYVCLFVCGGRMKRIGFGG